MCWPPCITTIGTIDDTLRRMLPWKTSKPVVFGLPRESLEIGGRSRQWQILFLQYAHRKNEHGSTQIVRVSINTAQQCHQKPTNWASHCFFATTRPSGLI
jgi:hypothetical protein